jgi:hypothetical protein
MWKHRWSVCVIALCLQCGGSATPAEEPTSPTESPEAPSAAPAGEEKPSEAPASEEKSGDKAEEKAAPAKKGCAGLPKNDCKVTVGCAWNDLKKCVEEGPAE